MSKRLTDERVREIADGDGLLEWVVEASPAPRVHSREAVTLAREVLAARAGDREEREGRGVTKEAAEAFTLAMEHVAKGLAAQKDVWVMLAQGCLAARERGFNRTDSADLIALATQQISAIDVAIDKALPWFDSFHAEILTRAAPGGETRKEANDG